MRALSYTVVGVLLNLSVVTMSQAAELTVIASQGNLPGLNRRRRRVSRKLVATR